MADSPAPDPTPRPADAPEPAAPAPEPAPKRASKAGFLRRLTTGTGVTLQMLALAIILVAVNGFAYKHYHRFDYSRDRKTSLSPRTKQFLASLTKPVKMIVYFAPGSLLQGDVSTIADEYRKAQPKYINLEIVDPYRSVGRATEIKNKYKLIAEENVVILDCEDRTKVLTEEKMAEFDNSGAMMNQPPTVTAFLGEQALTSGLLEVIEGKKSNVYYVQGHGEPGFAKGQPLETVAVLLQSEHLSTAELNLLDVPAVPADASLVLLVGAHLDLTEREAGLLNDYWLKGGRLMILLDPAATLPNLNGFLARVGIQPDDDRVLATIPMPGGYTGIVRDTVTGLVGNTPIAANLQGITPVFLGGAQSLTLQPEVVSVQGIKLAGLLLANPKFWGETNYKDLQNTGAYDDANDRHAPLYIAATVEKGAAGDQRMQVGAARMIVVGQARFIESGVLDQRTGAFFEAGLNWLLEREALIAIPPKQVHTFALNLTDEQTTRFLGWSVFAIPAFFALVGVIVWWRRRA